MDTAVPSGEVSGPAPVAGASAPPSPPPPRRPQRHGHRGPLWEVLKPDADGERYGPPKRGARYALRNAEPHSPEAHPNSQPLRDVVQSYGGDEQHAAAPARLGPLRLL